MSRWNRDLKISSGEPLYETTIGGLTLKVKAITQFQSFDIVETLANNQGFDKSKMFEYDVEAVNNGVGSMKTMTFYSVDASAINKKMFRDILDLKDVDMPLKLYTIKNMIDFLNTKKTTYIPPWRSIAPRFKIIENNNVIDDDDNWCYYLPINHKRVTLDDIHELFNGKPTKAFLRSILSDIDLQNSSANLIMDYIEKDKIDIFRVIGKSNTVQMNKKQLKRIIAMPQFNRQTTTGLIGGIETGDIVNRRAVISYQNDVDSEIFMSLVDSIKDEYARKKFLTTINRKSILEKYKIYPDIILWIKMQ
jgi:hypothetical protein